MSSQAVLADAQFGIVNVLKPFPTFTTVYEGLPGDTPVAFPGGLDPDAGKPGFSANLQKALSVPMGSKLEVWIPTIALPSAPPQNRYNYQFVFRLRNLRDFRERRSAYHFPKSSVGQDAQFVIPAGKRTILFEGGVSTDTVGNHVNTTVTSFESVQPKTGVLVPARTPTGAPAALQQGLGAATLGNTTATFDIVTLDAEGDELIILVTKDREAVWSFDTDDSLFRDFYSLPDVGIYVFSGSNP